MSYFLKGSAGHDRCWIDADNLDGEEKRLIDMFDDSGGAYSKLDAAWQALNRGVICEDVSKTLDLKKLKPLTIEEEYRFVRRFFSPIWFFYCYFLRLVMLKNPFRETRAFMRASRSKRLDLFGKHRERPDYDAFESGLVAGTPLVSVVIPTLNRYEYLYDVMRDLEAQDYSNFEVIVVDQSESLDESFYEQFNLNLTLIKQREKALWLARNVAIRKSVGKYLLLYDDDSRVDPDWIRQHLKCLDYFQADISSGVSLSAVGAKIPPDYAYFRWSGQLDTGNVMLKKEVFNQVGLFDRQFEKQRMGDGEFGCRCHINGLKNISNPYGKRIHLKVGTGGLRQMGSWDAFRPKRLISPRPIPSVLYLCRRYFGNQSAVFLLLRSVLPSIVPYRFKGNKMLMVLGSLLAVLMLPLILIQVGISWKRSSRMLAEGAKIEPLQSALSFPSGSHPH